MSSTTQAVVKWRHAHVQIHTHTHTHTHTHRPTFAGKRSLEDWVHSILLYVGQNIDQVEHDAVFSGHPGGEWRERDVADVEARRVGEFHSML
jgi:hypothetical protein